MRVTIYFNSSYPYGFAATNRVHQLCKGLSYNNVNVELIITNPTESSTNSPNGKSEGNYEGINFKYINKRVIRKKSKVVNKIIDYGCHLKIYKHLFSQSKNSDSVIVIGGATTDFRVLIPFFARLIRKKVFLEINEYPFVTKKDSILKSLKQSFFFNATVPSYDGFIVISDLLANVINRKKRKSASIIKIPILSEKPISISSPDSPPFSLPYIIHAGSMFEEKDGLIGCLQAFAIAKRKLNTDILYIIAGDITSSPVKSEIKSLIQTEDLDSSVFFIGCQTKNELCYYYKHASLAIINKYETKQNNYGFATKISEYIAFGIPMILTMVGEINNYFKNNYNAILVEPNSIEQLSDAIVKLIRNKLNAKILATNAFLLLDKEFSPRYQGTRLKMFLDQIPNTTE